MQFALSDSLLFHSMFIEADKVTEGYGKASIFRSAERIYSKRALEPSHDDCKAQRVESRIQQFQAVCQRRQPQALLSGHLPELGHDHRSNFHIFSCLPSSRFKPQIFPLRGLTAKTIDVISASWQRQIKVQPAFHKLLNSGSAHAI